MENHFAKLLSIMEEQKMSEEDKALWRSFVLCAGQNGLRPIIAAMEEKPGTLLILTENLRRKIDIMKREDDGAWTALLRGEEMF